MPPDSILIYGSCVALGNKAALLKGVSGRGKSDLALRFIYQPQTDCNPSLVSDDQTLVEKRGNALFARPPETIAGKIEVRGLGILDIPYRSEAQLCLIVHLVPPEQVPRMPPFPLPTEPISGIKIPVLLLTPLEASAPLKLRLALEQLV